VHRLRRASQPLDDLLRQFVEVRLSARQGLEKHAPVFDPDANDAKICNGHVHEFVRGWFAMARERRGYSEVKHLKSKRAANFVAVHYGVLTLKTHKGKRPLHLTSAQGQQAFELAYHVPNTFSNQAPNPCRGVKV
jgi:hypothetical protein